MPRQSEKTRSGARTHKGSPADNAKSKAEVKNPKYAEERERVRQEHTIGPDEPEQDAKTHPNRNRNKPNIDKHTNNQS